MSTVSVDEFHLLLNEINHELTEKNLQSLVHLANVPGAVAEKITNGLLLFQYLRHADAIRSDDVRYLRDLLRKMRPRRRDLVVKIDQYIKKKHRVDDVSMILGELSASNEYIARNKHHNGEGSENDECKIDFSCVFCACRYCPSWLLPLFTAIIGISLLTTCIVWYHGPRALKYNDDLEALGIVIIAIEGIAFLGLLSRLIWKLTRRQNYQHMVNAPPQANYGFRPESSQPRNIQCGDSNPRKVNTTTPVSGYGSGHATEQYSTTDDGTDYNSN